jgi:hypothetical protein
MSYRLKACGFADLPMSALATAIASAPNEGAAIADGPRASNKQDRPRKGSR